MSLKNTSYFNPTSVGGCTLWLDAADSSTITLSGSTVTQWNDKSGNGYNTTSYGGTPTLLANAINGVQSISFNGSSYLTGNNTNTGSTGTFFIIATVTSGQGAGQQYTNVYSFSRPLNGTSNGNEIQSLCGLICINAGPSLAMVPQRNNGNGPTFTAPNYNSGFLHATVLDGTNMYGYGNGSPVGSVASSGNFAYTFYNVGSQTYQLSGVLSRNYYWTGYVGELIAFNTNLSTTQRQQIEGYLAWKWGLTSSLPSSHPYALVPSYGVPSLVPNAPAKTTQTNSQHPVLAVSGCCLWLDPVNSSSLTLSGTDVIAIQDLSPLKNNASRYNGSAYATAVTVSGNRILSFPGANITYRCSLVLSGAAYTIFTVSSLLSTTGNGSGYQRIINADNGGGCIFVGAFNGDLATFSGTNGFNDINANTPAYTLTGNGLQIITIYVSGSTLIPYTNGTAQTTKVGTTGTTSVLDIGAYQNSSQNWNGYIGDIIIYSNALSTTQRQSIEGYLAQKWGLTANLPAGHPYKSSFPLYPSPITTGVRSVAGKRWSPLAPGGCGLWLDASDTSTLFQDSAGTIAVTTSGQPIGLWKDKSGSGHDFSQTSSGNRVTYDTSTKGALQLSSPTYLQASAASLGTVSTSANLTIIMTASTGPSASWQIILAQWFTGTNRFHLSFQSGTDLTPNFRSASTGTEISYPMSGTMAYNRTYTIGFIATGTALYMSFMGTSNTTTMSAALSTGPTSALTIADSRNANLTDGKIQEIIIYPSAISTTAFQQAEGYLAWKWGLNASLPSSHPYKLFPPSP